jgi:hypothetical protein
MILDPQTIKESRHIYKEVREDRFKTVLVPP